MRIQIFLVILLIAQTCFAPPVSQTKKEANEQESEINGLENYMEYHRYLKEIVNALESDPEFRQKLEKADESDIKSGKIADELELVSHHVRTQLDEIKRVELERLKELTAQKRKLEDPSNSIDEDPVHHHVDHSNPHTFEVEDLKKLIAKTTADLAEADKKRKEQFKQYELEKEYKKIEKLNHTNGDEREKLRNEFQQLEEKHKKHEKLHEPGHKAQLEEVWEEQDQMQQDFDPKTFFMLHDVDGNGLWDQDEVKSLFIKELDKMYQQGAPEDDMRERYEEMERMRESVFNEMDKNRDGFIDFNEFLHQTNTNDFKQDNGWQGLDEQKPFTDEELAEYIRQHEAANQIPQGHQVPPAGYHQVPPGGYQEAPQQVNYNQVPQGGYQQVPPGGYQQVPPGGYQQVPQGGYQQNPNGYQQHQQAPQGNNQVPQVHQQVPPGGYQQVSPGGYQQVPHGGYQQGGYQQAPQGGYQQVQQGQNVPPPGVPHPQQGSSQSQQGNVEHHNDLNTNEVNPHQSKNQQNIQGNPPSVPLQHAIPQQNAPLDQNKQVKSVEHNVPNVI
ncbi:nucleobindin 1 [Leptinotarsa decemlineata]|uniref:nucleobindin 1 n=1 Tax=Leptinotarsa decemlineata TaxID=7539 RepID=UPI003D30A59E